MTVAVTCAMTGTAIAAIRTMSDGEYRTPESEGYQTRESH
jgi:hypothetical protein